MTTKKRAVRPFRGDGYTNLTTNYGTQKDSHERYYYAPDEIPNDNQLTSVYESNGLFAKIIDAPAEEAAKKGFTIDGLKNQEIENFFYEALDELDWEEVAMTGIKWARLFGGAIAVLLVNDGGKLEDPLNWKNIRSIDDIRVYDRACITPDYSSMFSYDPQDPFRTRGSRLGMPEFYTVNSRTGSFRVHDSRVLTFHNGVLPNNISNSIYEIWGMPEFVRLKRAIRDADIAHSVAPKLLERSVQPVYKMKNLSELMQTEEGENIALRRLQLVDTARGFLNGIIVDAEGEDYDFKTFQFTGVPDVVDTVCNYLSALTSIPQTVLFGRSPAGFNSSGESDLENWYSYVERIQKRILKKNLRYLLSIIAQAGMNTGEINEVPEIKVKFNPLWSLDELEQAEVEQVKAAAQADRAKAAQTYVDLDILDPAEVRRGLADIEDLDAETLLDSEEKPNVC